jgi:hypothetical protein
MADAYPVTLEVGAPAPQNRLSVLLRIIFAIPAAIGAMIVGIVASVITLVAWIIILITGSYPQGMLNFSIGASRWMSRLYGYMFLLTDKYPPFSLEDDANYPIRLVVNGQTSGRNRLTVFFRIILFIPHNIIVNVLMYAAQVVAFIAWFAALFTGSVPAGMHGFMAGVLRWNARSMSYLMLQVDAYPPFSLS